MLLLRIFRQLNSSLLLHSQHFEWCLSSFRCFMLNSGVHTEFQTEPFIWTTGVDCYNFVNHDWVQVLSNWKYYLLFLPVVGIEPATSRWFHLALSKQLPSLLHRVSLPDNIWILPQSWKKLHEGDCKTNWGWHPYIGHQSPSKETGWLVFYGISTHVGYVMPNPIYIYTTDQKFGQHWYFFKITSEL